MIRRSVSVSLVLGLALVAFARPAAAVHRLTNVHGASCQPGDPETQHVLYSDTGMFIKSPVPTPPNISVACSVPWSQDFSATQPLQKIVVTLDWTCAPVPGGGTSFHPSCMFYMLTSNGGESWIPLTSINRDGTSSPEYVFVSPSTMVLPAYGTVVGSALYCNDVPAGVGILGYTIDTCFALTSLSC